ncbi:MAG TPA: S9 family peptidase, partial [Acidobacteriaceae bacterium]
MRPASALLHSVATVVLTLLCPVLATNALAQKRPITEKDLFEFQWIGDTQLSPDGATVAFVKTAVAKEREGYETRIYLLDVKTPGAEPKLFADGPRDSSPRWSPDGKQIAFLRSVEKEGKFGPPQLYAKPLTQGVNAVRLTDMSKGVSNPAWSPKGDAIAVISATPLDVEKAKLDAAKKARATGEDAHVSDVRIVTREIYRFNGEGNLDPSLAPQLYLVSLPKPDGTQEPAWQMTGGRFGVQEYLWAAGSDWIFYTSVHEEEPYYDAEGHNSIYGFEAKRGKGLAETGFTDDLKLGRSDLEARGLAISHDGRRIAFHAQRPTEKPMSHKQTDLWVMDLKWSGGKPVSAGEPKNLTSKASYEMGGSVGGDNTAPRGGGRAAIVWAADGKSLEDVAAKDGSALLVKVDVASGDMAEMTAAKQAVLGFVASDDGKTNVALISNPIMIGDLFAIGEGKEQTQLTHINDALFSRLDLKMPEELQVAPTVHAADIDGHA